MADVLLINPPYVRRRGGGLVPPIGLCYLASSLREVGATPRVLDLARRFPDYTPDDARSVAMVLNDCLQEGDVPDLIGIGPLVSATLRTTHQLLRECRAHTKAALVVGGALCATPGMSSVIGRYLDADAFVSGDGEGPLRAIWQSISSGRGVPEAVGVGRPGAPDPVPNREYDLDTLPLPARDLLVDEYRASARRSISASRMTSAFLSRGCPYSCTFCAAPLASGKRVRRHSSTRIRDELSDCARLGYSTVIFYDDCLFIRSPRLDEHVLEFCQSVAASEWEGAYQLELRCDAVVALSENALNALVASGCRQINMGIEKAHSVQLNLLRKRLSPSVAKEACDRVNSAGMRAAGTFIIGGIGETMADAEATISFANSLPLTFAHFNPLAVYPGTTLFSQVFPKYGAEEWLALCLDEELAPHGDILWRSDALPIEAILSCIETAYASFYSADRLQAMSAYLPPDEREPVGSAYQLLANERAKSWSIPGGTEGEPQELPDAC